MARQKKDGKRICYYVDREIFERLEAYAESKGQTMTTAIERIIEEFLDNNDRDSKKKK